jgi:hypothetical protein
MTKHKIYELKIPNDCIREYLDILRIEKSRADSLQVDFEWIFGDRVSLDFDGNRLEGLTLWFPGFYGRIGDYEQQGWQRYRAHVGDKLFDVNEMAVTVMLELMEEHGL